MLRRAIVCVPVLLAFAVAGSARAAGPLAWSAPVQVDHEAPGFDGLLVSISCPSASFCVASDSLGDVLTSTDPTGGYFAWHSAHVDSSALSMSCPSVSLCVAGDDAGNLLTSTNPGGGAGAWNSTHVASTAIGGGICQNEDACQGVSCPTVSLCIAVDGSGDVLSSTDPTGGSSAWKTSGIAPGGVLVGVSCASPSLCIAVGGTFPTATSSGGEIFTSTDPAGGGATWKVAHVNYSYALRGAACPSVSLCVAYGLVPPDSGGDVVTSTDPTGGDAAWAVATVDTDQLTGMSCPSPSLCVGVDDTGHVLTSKNPAGGSGAWGTLAVKGAAGFSTPFNDVSCPSVSLCVAADIEGDVATSTDPGAGVATWNSVHVDGGGNGLAALSCPSESFCAAIDTFGNVVGSTDPASSNAASWTAARTGADVADLSCPSASLCVGVDGQNIATSTDPLGGSPWTVAQGVLPSVPGGPGAVSPALSCSSTSFCATIESSEGCGGPPYFCFPTEPGYVATTADPPGETGAWTTTTLPSVEPASISCPTATFCAIGDLQGDMAVSTNPTGGASAWTTAHLSAAPIVGVSCVSATFCAAVDELGNVLLSTDPTGGAAAWHTTHLTPAAPQNSENPLSAVSCATATLCVAVDGTGNAYTSTDPTGGPQAWTAQQIDNYPGGGGLTAVSCPSARFCVAVDGAGNAIVGTPAPLRPPAPPRPPRLSSLHISPHTVSLAGRRVGRRCMPATRADQGRPSCERPIRMRVRYTLASATGVTFTIQRILPGRLVNQRCKVPTRSTRHRRHCTRLIGLRGSIARSGTPGANSFTFTGNIGHRLLGPGTYRLTATPTAGALTGASHTATLRIVR